MRCRRVSQQSALDLSTTFLNSIRRHWTRWGSKLFNLKVGVLIATGWVSMKLMAPMIMMLFDMTIVMTVLVVKPSMWMATDDERTYRTTIVLQAMRLPEAEMRDRDWPLGLRRHILCLAKKGVPCGCASLSHVHVLCSQVAHKHMILWVWRAHEYMITSHSGVYPFALRVHQIFMCVCENLIHDTS